jgi:hypothetical protein
MADSNSARAAADRNLLFGILALQMDFIDRDALVEAMNAWVLDKTRPLGQILQDRGGSECPRSRVARWAGSAPPGASRRGCREEPRCPELAGFGTPGA